MAFRLRAKRFDFVSSSRKWIFNLSSRNQPQGFSKSSLGRFLIFTTSLSWYRIYESSAYKRRVDATASRTLLTVTRIHRGPTSWRCCFPHIVNGDQNPQGSYSGPLWYPARNLSKVRKFLFNFCKKYPFRNIWFKS